MIIPYVLGISWARDFFLYKYYKNVSVLIKGAKIMRIHSPAFTQHVRTHLRRYTCTPACTPARTPARTRARTRPPARTPARTPTRMSARTHARTHARTQSFKTALQTHPFLRPKTSKWPPRGPCMWGIVPK